MPRVSAAFFAVGALCALMGRVTMSLFGTFYALTANTLSPRLAWANFVISGLGVAVMIPSLGLMLSTGNEKIEPFVAIGSVLTVIGLLVFGVSVVRELARPR